MKTRSGLVLFLAVLIGFPVLTKADVYMKHKKHTGGFKMMGHTQPGKDEIQETWIGRNKICSIEPERSTIMLLDQKAIIVLDHQKKTYSKIPMDFGKMVESATGEQKMSGEEKKDFMKMAEGMMDMKITITPTDETKKIQQWNCRKYIQKIETMMGPTTSEIWATEDLKMNKDMYAEFSASLMSLQPGMKKMVKGLKEEMEKIKGVPVLTITTANMMGAQVTSTDELIEYREGTAPAGTFDIPKNYKPE